MNTATIAILGIICCIIVSVVIGIVAYFASSNQPAKKSNAPAQAPTPAPTGPALAPALTPAATAPAATAPAATAPAAPAAAAPAPAFTKGSLKSTVLDTEGDRKTHYLDRHIVSCDSNGIKGFRMIRDGKGNLKYDYTCTAGGSLSTPTTKNTAFADDGKGSTHFLDKHDVDCGTNSALSRFKLSRNAEGTQVRFDYTCLSSGKPLQCRDVTTPAGEINTEQGITSIIWLDKHDVQCNDNETMSRFRLNRPDEKTIQYQYKCCKY